jgi:hypothetical protein
MGFDLFSVFSKTRKNADVPRAKSSLVPNNQKTAAKTTNRTGWSRPLDRPVKTPSGLVLRSLAEAGKYILDQPRTVRARSSWQRAADLLLKAANAAGRVEDARAAIELAIFVDQPVTENSRSNQVAPRGPPAKPADAAPPNSLVRKTPVSPPRPAPPSASKARPSPLTLRRNILARSTITRINQFLTSQAARLAEYIPFRDRINPRLRRWKIAALNILGLSANLDETPVDKEAMRRGFLFGIGSLVIFGVLILLLPRVSSFSAAENVVLFAITAILTLLTVIVLLVADILG